MRPLIFLNKIILIQNDVNPQNQPTYKLCEKHQTATDKLLSYSHASRFFFIPLDAQLEELEPLLETHTFERLSRFKSEEFTRKNIVYELSSSIGLNALSEEQLNSWMHEAFIRTSELGIKLDINTDIPGSPLLVIHGTFVTSISQIIPIQMMLIDLALLTPTALWVTEILNDQETIINYTTLSKTHLLWRKVSSEQN